ncbi:MAG: heme transporter ATP-binding protein [Rhodoglobus sp.]|nr:heme transporter ATP-binding protein [Rhodoglobus sp.]
MKLELRGVTKRFGTLIANDHIDLIVEPGEIHSLLGENGAGKSTLMNVLYGLYQADQGEILLDDVVQHFAGPGDAMAAGIGMVHQHFMLIPVFTVAENVMLGHEDTKFGGRLDLAGARDKVREISARFGFHVDPDALVDDLPVGVQQRVEIIKALSRDAKVLVFDEPTAVLTPQETDELMEIMRQLKASGTSIVFITHKLREVREVADRITVIRLGKVVGQASPTATNEELASMMVGRAVDLTVAKGPAHPGPAALVIEHLSVIDTRNQIVVNDVSFEVHEGEILAIAGVQGNGQTELTEAIMGLQPKITGSIHLDGKTLRGGSVRRTLDAGVGFIPEDRQEDGLVAEFTIAENLMLDRADKEPFVKFGTLQLNYLAQFAAEKVKEFDIRAQGITTHVGRLSGGNQQKVVLARELSRDLRLFVAAQPTRGLDVGSIEFVHTRIVQARDAGVPVIVVSTELDEVVALADRIAVMYRGSIVGIVPGDTPRAVLGLMMAGELPASVKAVA